MDIDDSDVVVSPYLLRRTRGSWSSMPMVYGRADRTNSDPPAATITTGDTLRLEHLPRSPRIRNPKAAASSCRKAGLVGNQAKRCRDTAKTADMQDRGVMAILL